MEGSSCFIDVLVYFGVRVECFVEWFELEGIGPVQVDDLESRDTLQVGKLPESLGSISPGEYITRHMLQECLDCRRGSWESEIGQCGILAHLRSADEP